MLQSIFFTFAFTLSSTNAFSNQTPPIAFKFQCGRARGSCGSIQTSMAACTESTNQFKSDFGIHDSGNTPDLPDLEMWEVWLLNDADNTRSYISQAIHSIAGLSEKDSYVTMNQVNNNGISRIGIFSRERAEHYKDAFESRGVHVEAFPTNR